MSVTLRGSGAAPFGIAATLLGTTNLGYNLGLLAQAAERGGPEGVTFRQVLPVSESYQGTMDFELRASGRNRWELERLEIKYDFVDSTRMEYDGGKLVDAMTDAGTVTFAEGRWHSPGTWQPESDPEITLATFRAETADQCEESALNRALLEAKALVSDTSDWVTCYDLEIHTLHPMRPTGESHWTSPIGEISVKARDGVLEFSGDTALAPPEELPLPPGTPEVTRQQIETMLEMGQMTRDFLRRGMGEIELDSDMTWERRYRGLLRGAIEEDSTYAILSGAQARERLELSIVDLVLEKVDESWRPSGEKKSPPVEVAVKSRWPDSEPVRLRITLYEVTREKGTCLNSRDDSTELDLYLEASDNPQFKAPEKKGDGWMVESREPLREATLRVRARDFGAWGRVKAEGKLGGNWYPIEVADSAKDYTTIPLDEEGGENYIADSWERGWVELGSDPTSDDEEEPLTAGHGDGIALYEEYRGFLVDGEHQRTSPVTKDLFIHFQRGSSLGGYADSIREATGLLVRKIRANEFVNPGTRVINPNRGRLTVTEQHGLYAVDWFPDGEYLEAGTAGLAECAGGVPGRPKDCIMVVVSVEANDRETTLVHEVLHALEVWHHGDKDAKLALCKVDGVYYPILSEAPCTERGGVLEKNWVAYRGGQHSGDQECVMVYDDCASFWKNPQGFLATNDDGSLAEFEEVGARHSHLCGGPHGTHFNSDGKQAGNASRGSCDVQIWVSDE